MRRRAIALLSAGLADLLGAGLLVHCSGKGGANLGFDAGSDGTAGNDVSVIDGSRADSGADAASDASDARTADALATGSDAEAGVAEGGGADDGAAKDAQADSGLDAGPEAGDAAGGDAAAGDAGEGGVACDSTHPCTAPLTCCSSACVDTSRDPRNCGGCGIACGGNQFCASRGADAGTGLGCADAVFANLCANASATVILDDYSTDVEAGLALGAALTTSCGPAVTVGQTGQLAPGTLDPDSGRPLVGVGNTLIAGGGSYGQLSVRYLDRAGLTPVYLQTDGTTAQYFDRATGSALVDTAVSALGTHHDFFFLELSVEPQSGSLCFVGAGILGYGTVAAGYYGATQVIPNHAGDPHSWYVVEWTDGGDGGANAADGIPNAGDTFRVVAMGP